MNTQLPDPNTNTDPAFDLELAAIRETARANAVRCCAHPSPRCTAPPSSGCWAAPTSS